MNSVLSALAALSLLVTRSDAFAGVSVRQQRHRPSITMYAASGSIGSGKTRRARDLVQSLVEEESCFSSEQGARAFGEVCAINVVYEDRFKPQPFVGKKVSSPRHRLERRRQEEKM
jgi:hypothetical protein